MENIQKYCVIDCRVSDNIQLFGNSLGDQETIGRLVAKKLGFEVAEVFRKPHSATTTERDDIQEVIDFIKKDKRIIKYYIVKSIDRLTRGGYPEYMRIKDELEKIGVKIIDAQGIIQPNRNTLEHFGGNIHYGWSMHSPSESAEMLEAYKGKAEVRDILTRLVGAEISLVQDGYSVRRAPDGLKNNHITVDGKKKVIREADPTRVDYFLRMFELLSDGIDYPEVVSRLNSIGFRTKTYQKWDRSDKEHPRIVGRRGGIPLTVKQLQRYILQTEYAGINYEKWTRHNPIKLRQFDGIVSIDIFNRANRGKIYIKINKDQSIKILHNHSAWSKVRRFRDNPKYPWKCILCPLCHSEMLASVSKGKYPAYHCGGWTGKGIKRTHKYYRIPQNEFEKAVRSYFDSLKFNDGFLAGLELHLLDKYREREKEILKDSSAISRTVSDLKSELAKKLDTLDSVENLVVKRMIETHIAGLDTQIKQVEEERDKIEINEKSIRTFRQYAGYIMEHPSKILTEAEDLRSRRTLLSLFFEEIPTYQEILNGTPKLTSLFKLSDEFKANKSQLVTLQGVEPWFSA